MQGQMWSSGAQRRYGRYQEKARCPTRCQTLKGGAFPRKSNQEQASRMPLQAARVPFPHKAKCPGHPLLALPVTQEVLGGHEPPRARDERLLAQAHRAVFLYRLTNAHAWLSVRWKLGPTVCGRRERCCPK